MLSSLHSIMTMDLPFAKRTKPFLYKVKIKTSSDQNWVFLYLKNYLISYTLYFAIINLHLMWYVEAICTKMWVVSILYQDMHTCESVIHTKRMDVRCAYKKHTYVRLYMYIHWYVHTSTCIHIYMHAYIYTCMHAYIHTFKFSTIHAL